MNAPIHGHDDAVRYLGRLLAERTGQRLSESRLWRMDVALRPLLRRHLLADRAALVRQISDDPAGPLADEVIAALLNHESSFFRDSRPFELIEHHVLPAIHAAKQGGERSLRIWCAGVASGQEAYSLAMILKHMGDMWAGWDVRLLATDVCPVSIGKARAGLFSQMEVQRGLPIDEMLRWFELAGDDWVISPALREMISFRQENLLSPAMVAGQHDLVLCRNVLLYFRPEQRRLALRNLHARCAPGGMLLLGAGETVQQPELFAPSRIANCFHLALPPGEDPAGLRA